MNTKPQPLEDKWVSSTKNLIAEVVLELYGDLDFLPKTKSELLQHYEKIGYLRDLDNHENEYSAENGIFLILLEGTEVVGCGGLRRHNQENGELVRLWLRKDRRNVGLGRMVFDHLLEVAERLGYSKVYLDTSHRCSDAISLFQRNGFRECEPYKESIGDVFMCRQMRDGQ